MNLSAEIWFENLESRRYLRLELLLSFANSTNPSHVNPCHVSSFLQSLSVLLPFWRTEDQNWRFQVHFPAAQPAFLDALRPRCILPEVLPNTDPPGHKAPSLWGADRPGERTTPGCDWISVKLPSGELTKSYWKWPFIVDFPIKHGDFPLPC